MLWILSSMIAMTQVGVSAHQSASLPSASFTSKALPKSKHFDASMGFWIGLAEIMLGFLLLYLILLLFPRAVNLIVAARRSYEEGFLQMRAREDGTYELVETVVHTLPTTVPPPAGKHSSIDDTNLRHTEGYAQHHGSAVTKFDSHVEGQAYTEATGQSDLRDVDLAGSAGEKADKGHGEQQ